MEQNQLQSREPWKGVDFLSPSQPESQGLAPEGPEAGIKLTSEPLNPLWKPDYLLSWEIVILTWKVFWAFRENLVLWPLFFMAKNP